MKVSFIILVLFLSKTLPAQNGAVAGRVMDKHIGIPVENAIVKLTPSDKTALTNEYGYFRIDSLPAGDYVIKIISAGFPARIFGVNIIRDSVSVFTTELADDCKYDAHRSDKTCPVCYRKDKVIPIVYGYPIGEMDNTKYYYAGCETTRCDPNWYCKRDKTKF